MEERRNSNFDPVCARNFNSFIFESELFEYNMRGRRFTFLAKSGNKLSKIDRVLVSKGVMDRWPEACLRALPRTLSDHSPLILTMKKTDFGPRPFRFFNSWLDREEFEKLILDANKEFSSVGEADKKLQEKFKFLKLKMILWREESHKKEKEKEDRIMKEMEEVDKKVEETDLEEEDLWIRAECYKDLTEIHRWKSKDLWQKARVK